MDGHLIETRGTASFDLYPYNPSATAGWAFVVLFGIAAIVHIAYIIPLRTWSFIPFVLGCIGEAFGYYGRARSHNNIRWGRPYLLQLMLILVSAPLLSASIYMTLGRFARALEAEHHAVLGTRWITTIYVLIDIASFVVQIMGSAMQASGDKSGMELGMNLVKGGLGVQLGAFGCFILMASVMHTRLNREPTMVSKSSEVQWRRYMWTLYGVSTLIVVRSAFRLIEFAGGSEGVLMRREAYLYVFDAAMMWSVTLALAVVHPGRLVRTVRKRSARTDFALIGGQRS